ncbi:hypothetical protein CB0940_08286 [Cercospora beticola]|uniref:Uncharacterized protein n=1 Tax=Cercospora beticola TaxID=122368 RepID=A0A2G5HQZ1_CERBT|nr:hypothetical protein CB0940_08286 [Cercospora beticola]PIA94938.1 hypothetical protein CB0940_08286 [Cercospora beticola]WPB04855.1 hypothetical protein RHO25_009502 [Cercospora beticola]CAK1364617.1 unnamed protein product [Cercospora beticola]
MAPKPTYTSDQIHQYYDRIQLPAEHRHEPGSASTAIAQGPGGLEYLSILQRYTLVNIPFENLALHYARNKVVDIDPQILFGKVVSKKSGRGGYCMEMNCLFSVILRTLGFKLYSTSGRVSSAASPDADNADDVHFLGFAHHINIVTIQGVRYHVDVAFGGGGPTKPLPLEDGRVHSNTRPSQEVRLRFDTIGENESNNKLWIYEIRSRPEKPWLPQYCFPDDLEFHPADFESMNFFTSTSSTSFFTWMVFVVKRVLSEDGREIVGESVMMGRKMYRRVLGMKKVEVEFKTERERVEALEKEFGIVLDEQERRGILGMASSIG